MLGISLSLPFLNLPGSRLDGNPAQTPSLFLSWVLLTNEPFLGLMASGQIPAAPVTEKQRTFMAQTFPGLPLEASLAGGGHTGSMK